MERVRVYTVVYSVMQSDRKTLKFNVVIIKFLRRHFRIVGSERNIKSMIEIYLSYYFQNMSKRFVYLMYRLTKSGSS